MLSCVRDAIVYCPISAASGRPSVLLVEDAHQALDAQLRPVLDAEGPVRQRVVEAPPLVRVGTVCVVSCSWVEERRVRGTGGVCRSRGDRGVEPLDINIPVQLSRGVFQRGATLPESNPNPNPNRTMSMDVKYDTTPCDGTPGQPWEDFKRRLAKRGNAVRRPRLFIGRPLRRRRRWWRDRRPCNACSAR